MISLELFNKETNWVSLTPEAQIGRQKKMLFQFLHFSLFDMYIFSDTESLL